MKTKLILAAFALTFGSTVWAKLPPPATPPDPVKVAEAKAKADEAAAKDKALLVLARRKTRPAPCRIVTPSEMGAILKNSGNLAKPLPAAY